VVTKKKKPTINLCGEMADDRGTKVSEGVHPAAGATILKGDIPHWQWQSHQYGKPWRPTYLPPAGTTPTYPAICDSVAPPLRIGDHTGDDNDQRTRRPRLRDRERERQERCESATPRGTPTGGSGSGVAWERGEGGYAVAAVAVFRLCRPEGAMRFLGVLLDGLELNDWRSIS
jgi:hypothetical protein